MSKDDSESEAKVARARERLQWFGFHILSYFIVMAALVALNLMTDPEQIWFVFPLVAWGVPLGLHAAFAMGLFDSLLSRD